MDRIVTQKPNKKTGSGFGKWLKKALLRSLLVVALVMLAVFFIIRLVPGDPAVMVLGEHANEAALQEMRERLGLNLPAGQQFAVFIKNILTKKKKKKK